MNVSKNFADHESRYHRRKGGAGWSQVGKWKYNSGNGTGISI